MKTAEEMLKDGLNENIWTFINTYPITRNSNEMLKDYIVDVMEYFAYSYHEYKNAQFAVPEISDEEIKSWSASMTRKGDLKSIESALIFGATWMRSQMLKTK